MVGFFFSSLKMAFRISMFCRTLIDPLMFLKEKLTKVVLYFVSYFQMLDAGIHLTKLLNINTNKIG